MRTEDCSYLDSRLSPSHSEPVDLERRLSNTDGYTLAFLAAGAYAGVELQIVADHGDAGQHIRAIADEGRALHRPRDLALLDEIGLGGREHKLARGDVDLPAAEVHGVQPLVHRGDDLGRIVVT